MPGFEPGLLCMPSRGAPPRPGKLDVLKINFANFNSYQIYIISEKGLQIPGIVPGSLCMLSRDASPRLGELDGGTELIL